MGLLDRMLDRFRPDRLLHRKPRWQYPRNEVLHLGEIDRRHDKTYPAYSRSSPGTAFEVNVHKLSCTCPGFQKSRGEYDGRDVRRVCPHILKKLRDLGLEKDIHPVLRMVMRHGREYRRFRRIKGTRADLVFGFSKRSPEVGVFAVLKGEEVRGTYDLDQQAWTDPPPPGHEPALLGSLRRTFQVQ